MWTIPKGEFEQTEDPLTAARREFLEETGINIESNFIELHPTKLKSGKLILAWAAEFFFDPMTIKSNTFTIEWPPKSGRYAEYPEVDRGEWFDINIAKIKIHPAQLTFIDQVASLLNITSASNSSYGTQQNLFE